MKRFALLLVFGVSLAFSNSAFAQIPPQPPESQTEDVWVYGVNPPHENMITASEQARFLCWANALLYAGDFTTLLDKNGFTVLEIKYGPIILDDYARVPVGKHQFKYKRRLTITYIKYPEA